MLGSEEPSLRCLSRTRQEQSGVDSAITFALACGPMICRNKTCGRDRSPGKDYCEVHVEFFARSPEEMPTAAAKRDRKRWIEEAQSARRQRHLEMAQISRASMQPPAPPDDAT